jgi:hypothetical protein
MSYLDGIQLLYGKIFPYIRNVPALRIFCQITNIMLRANAQASCFVLDAFSCALFAKHFRRMVLACSQGMSPT